MCRIGKSTETESRLVVSGDWREDRIESDCQQLTGFFPVIKIFWNWIAAIVAQSCEYTRSYGVKPFNIVMWNFILCEYFNKNEKESSIQSGKKEKGRFSPHSQYSL